MHRMRHTISILVSAAFIGMLLGTSVAPPPDPSMDFLTNEITMEYSVVLNGDYSAVRIAPRARNFLYLSGTDKIVVTSGLSSPVELTNPPPYPFASEVRFPYTEGDSINIAFIRANAEFPELLDAPDSNITPPPNFAMISQPTTGLKARDAILSFSWDPTGYDRFSVYERWECSNLRNESTIFTTGLPILQPGTYDVDVSSRLIAHAQKYPAENDPTSGGCNLRVEISGIKNFATTGLDTGFLDGMLMTTRIQTFLIPISPL